MRWLSGIGLLSVVILMMAAVQHNQVQTTLIEQRTGVATMKERNVVTFRFLALGDVNLGRNVGQVILKGDTLYPFVAVKDSLLAYDVVFANLESQLSDQKGQTQHPRNNLIFTGPPAGARTLRKAGITIVSTANNHALDYGVKALNETNKYLDDAGVFHVGTAKDASRLFDPVVLSQKGVRVAFFACTDVMNIEDQVWKQSVADADTAKLLPGIRAIRDSVDFIVVSYHGGDEYADHPSKHTIKFAQEVIAGGADLFLGHHPHISYGVEQYKGKYIIHSLGNFVFRQPDRFWAQRSFAFEANITKDTTGTYVSSFSCIPVMAGFQPAFTRDEAEIKLMLERIYSLSTQSLIPQLSW